MKGKSIKYIVSLCALGLLGAGSQVCAEDYLVSTGAAVAANGHTISAQADDGFIIQTLKHRSYVCEGVPSASDSEFGFSTDVVSTQSDEPETIEARANGNMAPLMTEGEGVEGRTRIAFIMGETNDRVRLSVSTAKEEGEEVRVACVNSSIWGGYNTFAARYNFLELRNLSNKPISGFITVHNFLGVDVVEQRPFTVPAHRRIDIDLHSATGRFSFGVVGVAHDGPFRALRGRVSYYSGTPGNLTRRGSVPLKPALN